MVAGIHGQALTEHAAAAAGAAIGSGAGKSLSNSVTKIFGDTDKKTAEAAKPEAKKPDAKNTPGTVTKPAPDPLTAKSKPSPARSVDGPLAPSPSSGSALRFSQPAAAKPVSSIHQDETATAVINAASMTPAPAPMRIAIEPVVKVPTVAEIANIKVGTTEDELLAALGQPASRLSIPDDDGHLRETCQYWANGRQIGTVRLDNGQVVTVETRPEN